MPGAKGVLAPKPTPAAGKAKTIPRTVPFTGADYGIFLIAGAALFGAGLYLRFRR